MEQNRYTISDLQKQTNTSKRTIHFYSQRGLIPRPDSRGGAATYPEEALHRLKIIKELQKRRFTLDEIYEAFKKDYQKLKERFIDNIKEEPKTEQVATKEQLSSHLLSNAPNILRSAIVSEQQMFYPHEDSIIDRILEEADRKEIKEEIIRKIKVAEGIELHIDEDTFKKYKNYIKRGVSQLQDILSEKRRGRPRKDKLQ
ncbi:MAG: helix-turn-helix domain-containing protein [Thermodesulfovibrionales bacterium]|nr:helix-turn-helix domain-containing protein [Thermodesulfovibrionales bacterium]